MALAYDGGRTEFQEGCSKGTLSISWKLGRRRRGGEGRKGDGGGGGKGKRERDEGGKRGVGDLTDRQMDRVLKGMCPGTSFLYPGHCIPEVHPSMYSLSLWMD